MIIWIKYRFNMIFLSFLDIIDKPAEAVLKTFLSFGWTGSNGPFSTLQNLFS
jgi:hypothetical protein